MMPTNFAELALDRTIDARREAEDMADEIQRLRLAMRESLETLEKYADRDMPPNVTGLFIGRFRAELNRS